MKGPNPRKAENPSVRSSFARAGNPSRPGARKIQGQRRARDFARRRARERNFARTRLRIVTRATAPIDPLRPRPVEPIDRVKISAAPSLSHRSRVRTGSKTPRLRAPTTPPTRRASLRELLGERAREVRLRASVLEDPSSEEEEEEEEEGSFARAMRARDAASPTMMGTMTMDAITVIARARVVTARTDRARVVTARDVVVVVTARDVVVVTARVVIARIVTVDRARRPPSP